MWLLFWALEISLSFGHSGGVRGGYMRGVKLAVSILTVLLLSACGNPLGNVLRSPDDDIPLTPDTGPHKPFDSAVCTKLDFSGMTWPSDLKPLHKEMLILALNISGSFEGADGWANLSDDFDGQGLSMGLLSQNLGQGTLQPLMIELRDKSKPVYEVTFAQARRESLLTMLAKWQGPVKAPSLLDSILDGVTNPDLESVQWARTNLYNKNTFVPEWKKELEIFATTQPYLNLQLKASMLYDMLAKDYMNALKLTQVRSYLVMFDIVVQNGGLTKAHIQEYWNWLFKNSKATEAERLRQIVMIRRNDVLPRWRANYLMRKVALINRKGTVNGTKRDLEKEYCFDGLETVPQD